MLELLHELDHIGAKAIMIGGRMPRLKNSVVDVPAQVFDKPAEDAPINLGDRAVRINRAGCRDHDGPFQAVRSAGGAGGD